MRITILDGHPRAGSLTHGLCDAYARGAEAGGHEVRRLVVRDLDFDIIQRGYKEGDTLEPDLVAAQETIEWCEHLVVIHPVWWGSSPAVLKGKTMRDRLIAGRSGRVIQTAATPNVFMRLAYWSCAAVALKASTLEFCGFKPVKLTQFGGVGMGFNEEKAQPWLEKCERLGRAGA